MKKPAVASSDCKFTSLILQPVALRRPLSSRSFQRIAYTTPELTVLSVYMFDVRPVHPLLARLTCPLSVSIRSSLQVQLSTGVLPCFPKLHHPVNTLLTTLLHLLRWNTKKR